MRINDYIKRVGQTDVELHEITPNELQRMHETMDGIASDVFETAIELGISCTLGGGSVLGAARHKGFIPWDDDIDINMPRSDWERFAEYFKAKYSNKYLVYSPDQYPDSNINAIRIYKLGTKLREVAHAPNEPNGLFVDIFLLENAPNNAALRMLHGVLCQGVRYIASCVRLFEQRDYIKHMFGNNKKAMFGYKLRFRIGRLFSLSSSHSWALRSFAVNGMCRNEDSRYLTIPSGGKYDFGELILRSDYFPVAYLPFGDHSWPVPRNYNKYLTSLYGDWRELPSEDERETHCLLELDFGDENDAL